MTKCKKCGREIEEISIYPHIDILKSGIDISDIPMEVLEDLPQPHLHTFYRCDKCKYVEALRDIPLLTSDEIKQLKEKGQEVRPTRTIAYWRDWLQKNKKGKSYTG